VSVQVDVFVDEVDYEQTVTDGIGVLVVGKRSYAPGVRRLPAFTGEVRHQA
ncbi:MAG: hypothetical protein HOI95_00105, partial [Chromatiales bacterium]|nr:hypothetical protein [Chromatiales bacterium]